MGIKGHPARFPSKLPEFFIKMLTEPGDLVVDIFSGSNTTGSVAETENRRWLSFEERLEYVAASSFRFIKGASVDEMSIIYNSILSGETVNIPKNIQLELNSKTSIV